MGWIRSDQVDTAETMTRLVFVSHLFDLTLQFVYSCALSLGGSSVAQFMDGDGRTGGCGLDRPH